MNATRKLFVTIAKGSIFFTIACWAATVALLTFQRRAMLDGPVSTLDAALGLILVVIVPDALAAWLVLRKLLADRPRREARRAATAFAVSAPLVLGIGHLLSELVGGYAEVTFGSRFILPVVAAFIIALMIFIPSGIVIWTLHPSGVGPISESDQNEHC